MPSKLFSCCGLPAVPQYSDECFSILCVTTIGPNMIPGRNDGVDNSVRHVKFDKCSLVIREIESIEKISKKQITSAHGIVFLLNSAGNKADIEERAELLRRVQEHPALCGTPCLLFATHQDQSTAISCDQLEIILDLSAVRASRCLLMHCCAGARPDAFLPGMKQLANELLKTHCRGGKMARSHHSLTELTTKTLDTLRHRRKLRALKLANPNHGLPAARHRKLQLECIDSFLQYKS